MHMWASIILAINIEKISWHYKKVSVGDNWENSDLSIVVVV